MTHDLWLTGCYNYSFHDAGQRSGLVGDSSLPLAIWLAERHYVQEATVQCVCQVRVAATQSQTD